MRRGLFIGLGALVALLWWQPWRRWMQHQSGEQLDDRRTFAPATTASYTPASVSKSSEARRTSGANTLRAPISSALDAAEAAHGNGREAAQPAAGSTGNSSGTSAEGSRAANAEDAGSPTEFSEFVAASNIPGMSNQPSSFAETSIDDGPASSAARSTPAETAGPTSILETPEADVAPSQAETSDQAVIVAGASMDTDTAAGASGATNILETPEADVAPSQAETSDQAVIVAGASTGDAGGASDSQYVADTGSAEGASDDLEAIEGIGPKTASVLRAAGITTFSQIAETEAERLHQIVREGGITTANPTTWPMQAQLAAKAKWDELKELQEEIKNGRLRR